MEGRKERTKEKKEKWKLVAYLKSMQKINIQWIKDQNVWAKTYKIFSGKYDDLGGKKKWE